MKKIALFKNKAQNVLLAVEAMATAVMTPIIGRAFSEVTVNQGALNGVDPFAIAGSISYGTDCRSGFVFCYDSHGKTGIIQL